MHVCRFRLPCLAALWTLAITLMASALLARDHELGDVSVLVGVVACVPSGWLIVDHVVERAKQEAVRSICEAIGYALADGKLHRLR